MEWESAVTVVVRVTVDTTDVLAGAVIVLVATVVTRTCCVETLSVVSIGSALIFSNRLTHLPS